MFIDLVSFAKSFESIHTVASCQFCGSIWALTEDEVQVFTNQKNDYVIKGFTCPNCESQLILPPEGQGEDGMEEGDFYE